MQKKGIIPLMIIGFFVIVLLIIFIFKESFTGGILNPSTSQPTTYNVSQTKIYRNIAECPTSIDVTATSFSILENKLNEMLPCRYTNGCSMTFNGFHCLLTGFG